MALTICPQNGALRCLQPLLFCFVVSGFLAIPLLAAFPSSEYDFIENQSFEFERADPGDEEQQDGPASSGIETPPILTETEMEARFNAMLKARNLTDKFSAEMIQQKFDSVVKNKRRPTKGNRGPFFPVDPERVIGRLKNLTLIKRQYNDLFGQKFDVPENPPNKESFLYEDSLARKRIFPMAAAAYGSEDNVRQCLTQIYGDANLTSYKIRACQNKGRETCGGFLAHSESEKAIILSFRGTNSLFQLIREFDGSINNQFSGFLTDIVESIEMPKPEGSGGGNVSAYFYDIFTDIWISQRMVLDVARLIKENPGYKIYVTGHSLGGALAALAARYIQMDIIPDHPERIYLLTFGQPRTGDKKWASLAENALSYFNYRVVDEVDVVPHVPPEDVLQHMKTEVWYNRGMGEKDNPRICADSGESSECSNSEWTPGKIWKKLQALNDHAIYFGLCVPVYGRRGCVTPTGFGALLPNPALYHCIDPKFILEFVMGSWN